MRRIEGLHLERGWQAVGYHLVIMPSGRVFLGRPATVLGAHVKGWNRGTLGICLVGDFDLHRPTSVALRSLMYVRSVLVPTPGPLPLIGHSDLAPKRCPGQFLHRYADRQAVDSFVVSRAAYGSD